jgi:hypothetical protein
MLPDWPFETGVISVEARITAGEQINPLVWLLRHLNNLLLCHIAAPRLIYAEFSLRVRVSRSRPHSCSQHAPAWRFERVPLRKLPLPTLRGDSLDMEQDFRSLEVVII